MILATHGILANSINFDSDAQAFITAASITDTIQKNAVNQLVLDLKSYSIWTKFKAIYPFVGGSASQHRFNLKLPTTNISDFYGTFVGGGTHTSTGYLPNGTTGYMETNLTPSISLGQNSTHISFYSRTDNNVGVEMSARWVTGGNSQLYLGARASGTTASRLNNLETEAVVANTDGRGMYLISRTASNGYASFKNTTKTAIVKTSSGLPNLTISIGAQYYNGWYYASKEIAFASIGDGLTDTDVSNLYTAVNTYQVALGRNV
jgi:hypothetical protein